MATNINITRAQKQSVHVAAFDRDNQPDSSSPLTLSGGNSSIATAAVDPGDNRTVVITGVAPGFTTWNVNVSPAVPTGVQFACTIADTPNVGHVDFVSADSPVSKF